MERNRWETAIRCLEVALHPNTSDNEVIAAVNGFRRTADRSPLREICVEFVGAATRDPAFYAIERSKAIDRLRQENRDIRSKLDAEERARISDAERLREMAEQVRSLEEALGAARQREDALSQAMTEQVHNLQEALAAARRESDAAAREFADFRLTQGQILAHVNRDNAALRRALEEARREAAAAPGLGRLPAAMLQADADSRKNGTNRPAPANLPGGTSRSAWIA
jgi:hypothetical protein